MGEKEIAVPRHKFCSMNRSNETYIGGFSGLQETPTSHRHHPFIPQSAQLFAGSFRVSLLIDLGCPSDLRNHSFELLTNQLISLSVNKFEYVLGGGLGAQLNQV